jgi:hypothetical protein
MQPRFSVANLLSSPVDDSENEQDVRVVTLADAIRASKQVVDDTSLE